MRLIDADAIMIKFADFVKSSNNSDFVKTPTWNDAVSIVDSQPTAYDKDKVIEQIRNIHLPIASQTTRIIGIIKEGGING